MGVFCKWTRIEINCHNIKNTKCNPLNSVKRIQHERCASKAIYPKEPILKIVKVPKPMRMVWGSAIAYWLAGIINPACIAIAVMFALFIPILIVDPLFPSRSES